ncbi:hypothetical protein B0T21DRAFT_394475 [Apiosordaria backusii]|uniref:Uncharacterized protein n=1 Tax=Apiosordaria backusii TaxID=314023 RepID=A0AA40B7L4_9PEZI|nr:hypothetical protein B0T21DRAFT_394475 [Apiosordaria backusii]
MMASRSKDSLRRTTTHNPITLSRFGCSEASDAGGVHSGETKHLKRGRTTNRDEGQNREHTAGPRREHQKIARSRDFVLQEKRCRERAQEIPDNPLPRNLKRDEDEGKVSRYKRPVRRCKMDPASASSKTVDKKRSSDRRPEGQTEKTPGSEIRSGVLAATEIHSHLNCLNCCGR